MGANCRGFVTTDVLVKGLCEGAIAPWWRLKGGERKRDSGLPRFGTFGGGKSLRPALCILMGIGVRSPLRVVNVALSAAALSHEADHIAAKPCKGSL